MNIFRPEETADSDAAELVPRFRGRTVLVLGDVGEGTTATIERVRSRADRRVASPLQV
jgi:hypothetical protein